MRSIDGTRLKEYLTCPRLPYLAFHLDDSVTLPPTETMEILFRTGHRVEGRILEQIEPEEVVFPRGDFDAGFRATLDLMDQRAPAIANGVLKLGEFLGRPDLLLLNEEDGRYEVADVKSTCVLHASAVMQVTFYSRLLGQIRAMPRSGYVILRHGERRAFPVADYLASVEHLIRVMQRFRGSREADPGPHRQEACLDCRYHDVCAADLESSGDPGQLAAISRAEAAALRREGWDTVESLAGQEDRKALALASGLGRERLDRVVHWAQAVQAGRPRSIRAPTARLAEARFGLTALCSNRLEEPNVAVAGQVFGQADKFRVRFLRRPESDQPAAELGALLTNLSRSRGPILVFGTDVEACLAECVEKLPALQPALKNVTERLLDLRAELRRSRSLAGFDRTPVLAARALGLADPGDADDLAMLRYLEGEPEGDPAAIDRQLRRDLELMHLIRDHLLDRGAA